MLPQGKIQRSISRMTLDLSRAAEARRRRADNYGLAEREYQAQYEFTGHTGVIAGEAEIPINFYVTFIGDAGNQRDSELDRPHAKLTIEMLLTPAGAIPYAYVTRWKLDPDFNFIGAVVKVGMHCPALAIAGQMPVNSKFHGILHASFQGFAALNDVDTTLSTTTDTGEELF